MGWVDPWVGSGRIGSRFFIWWVGVGWVHYGKSTKMRKDYVNAFKARLVKNMNKLMLGGLKVRD